MKTIQGRSGLAAAAMLAAGLLASPFAHAQLTGTVYEADGFFGDADINPSDNIGFLQNVTVNGTYHPSVDPNSFLTTSGSMFVNSDIYSGQPQYDPTYTLPNESNAAYFAGLQHANFVAPSVNFQSNVGGYDIGGFLNNPTFYNATAGFNSSDSLDNVLIELTGSILLSAGPNTFTIQHDDGLVLNIGGQNIFDEPYGSGPDTNATANFGAPTAGYYSMTLDYVEAFGAPADLVVTLNGQSVAVGVPDGMSTASVLALALVVLAGSRRRFSWTRGCSPG